MAGDIGEEDSYASGQRGDAHVHGRIEPHIFQRVGSTGVTDAREPAGGECHAGVGGVGGEGRGERQRGLAPVGAECEKNARLSVGRNGVYRSLAPHTCLALPPSPLLERALPCSLPLSCSLDR